MTVEQKIRKHFMLDDDWLDAAILVVFGWPMLPMSLAKGRHWLLRLAALSAYPLLFAVNIPFMIVLMLPLLMCAFVRLMWREMAE